MGEAGGIEERDALDVGGGVRLACRDWPDAAPSASRPRAVLGVVHGYGEHCGRYGNLVDALVPRGYAVASFDHRGHGRSPGRRGHIDRFTRYVDDTRTFLERLRGRHPDVPVVLLGHSMGGLVAAALAEEDDAGLSALILSSPLFGLRLEVPPLQVRAARLLSAIAPTVPLGNPLRNEDLSRDQKVVAAAAADTLNHRKTTVRWGAEAMAAMERVVERAGSVRLPLLLLVAGGDRIADPGRSEEFFAGAGSRDKTILRYEGFYHELFNEIGRERVFDDVSGWLDVRLPGLGVGDG